MLIIDLGCKECETGLDDAEFEAKYKATKQEVRYACLLFQVFDGDTKEHIDKRKEMHDFLTSIL